VDARGGGRDEMGYRSALGGTSFFLDEEAPKVGKLFLSIASARVSVDSSDIVGAVGRARGEVFDVERRLWALARNE
jgi:hypothetical protein